MDRNTSGFSEDSDGFLLGSSGRFGAEVNLAGHRRGPEGGEVRSCPQRGQRAYRQRRLRWRPRRKLTPGRALWRLVRRQLLQVRWSPGQIAATLARMHPDDPTARVSHETIYAMIYAQARGGLQAALVEALRHAKPRRGVRRRALSGSAIGRRRWRRAWCPGTG